MPELLSDAELMIRALHHPIGGARAKTETIIKVLDSLDDLDDYAPNLSKLVEDAARLALDFYPDELLKQGNQWRSRLT